MRGGRQGLSRGRLQVRWDERRRVRPFPLGKKGPPLRQCRCVLEVSCRLALSLDVARSHCLVMIPLARDRSSFRISIALAVGMLCP